MLSPEDKTAIGRQMRTKLQARIRAGIDDDQGIGLGEDVSRNGFIIGTVDAAELRGRVVAVKRLTLCPRAASSTVR